MNKTTAIIISIGLILASTVFGIFFLAARNNDQTVNVVGYATKNFECDLVKWEFQLHQTVDQGQSQTGLQQINTNLEDFKDYISNSNIEVKDMNIQPVNSRPEYEKGEIVGQRIFQKISILTESLDEIEELAINPAFLSQKGINIENSRLKYFKNDLDQLKENLLGKATQNAKVRANKILEPTDLKIDKMISANSGVFQITEQYSTRVSSYGVHNTSSRKKTIKVTVRTSFKVQ